MSHAFDRVHVVVAVLINERREVLISKRPVGAHQGGLWEFPGGKLKPGEGVEAGLCRELQEELGILATTLQPMIRIAHDYPDKSVVLDVWRVEEFRGEPVGCEGQPIRWVPVGQLSNYQFPAANLPIITALGLPDCYLITPEPGDDMDGFLGALERSLSTGLQLVQFRARQLSEQDYRELLPGVLQRCQQRGARVLLNADPALAEACGAAGVHLSSERLLALSARPLAEHYLVAASCHNAEQLRHAHRINVDFVVVSPVRPTASHPGAQTLEFSGLQRLTEQAVMPVYALGGMRREDLATVYQCGAQGIAAISSLWNSGQPLESGDGV